MPTSKLFAVERVPVSALRLGPNNDRSREFEPRTFSGAAILIDDSNLVLAGHAAVKAAEALGLERVVCARVTPATAAETHAAMVQMVLQLEASTVAALREASFELSDPDDGLDA